MSAPEAANGAPKQPSVGADDGAGRSGEGEHDAFGERDDDAFGEHEHDAFGEHDDDAFGEHEHDASVRSGGGASEGDADLAPRRPRDWLREQHGLPRRKLAIAGAVGLVLFVVVSLLLGRYLSTENAERGDVFNLLRAQAAGNADAMIAQLSGCRRHAGCVAQARRNAAALRRPGAVKILTLSSKTAYALTSASGTTRVAWTVIGRLPTVQCVGVERHGNFLSGLSVRLVSLSAPIPGEEDC